MRADGRWMGRISLGHDSSGKHIRKAVYGKTLKEARDKADQLAKEYESGLTVEKVGTVAEYLDQWIELDIKTRGSGNKTISEYEDTVTRYVKPYIGHHSLKKLTSLQCRNWLVELTRKGFTPNMRKRAIRVFSVAMSAAVRADLITRNPLQGVPRPKVNRRHISPLSPDQCVELFKHCQTHRLGQLIIVAALTGLRKGELFALDWSDVNLRERVITVRRSLEEVRGKLALKSPKTAAGRRAVLIDEVVRAALVKRMDTAIAEGLPPAECPIVFPNNIGGHLRGNNFDRNVWYPIREAAGLPKTIRFHDLRHTQASLMLAAGVHPKVVQERLGHSDISLTLNTYSHLLNGLQAEGVEKMAKLIQVSQTAADEADKAEKESQNS